MGEPELHVVTGAFGYSGRYIAARLLEAGCRVRTLTNSPERPNPFGGKIAAHPFNFDQPDKLVASLRGASVLYNTYWVRFNHGEFGFQAAVRNSLQLFEAAGAAGVRRVVHVSITNPAENSPLEYFRGKARLERALGESGLSHAILRPAVLFGGEDILVNNIAWALRRFPVYAVFGDGQYRLQPIYVEDFAELAVAAGRGNSNAVVNATGPETFTYRGLVLEIGQAIGKPRRIISLPPSVAYAATWLTGKVVHDVIITRDEIKGLMAGLLCADSHPLGKTRLSAWAREHADSLGEHYASELARRQDRRRAYNAL
jgi:NADH dehydrogenase